jgi:hypothetical protein
MKRLFTILLVVIILSSGTAYATDSGDTLGGLTSKLSAEDDVTYGVGETATIDGVSATLIEVSGSGGLSKKPAEGNHYSVLEFTIENNTAKPLVINPSTSFSAI